MKPEHLRNLIQEWMEFTAIQPEGDVTAFSRWVLQKQQEAPPVRQEPIRESIGFQLGQLIRFVNIWEKKAFADLPLRGFMEFGALATVAQAGFPRKSDVVKELLVEPSTGFEVLKKLVREGFLSEIDDSGDHRTVRLKLSPLGRRVLAETGARVSELSGLLLGTLSNTEMMELERQLLLLNQFHFGFYESHKSASWKAISEALSHN